MKRHASLTDLSLTRDEQEIEFLRLQVLEQQHLIDDLSLVRAPRGWGAGSPIWSPGCDLSVRPGGKDAFVLDLFPWRRCCLISGASQGFRASS